MNKLDLANFCDIDFDSAVDSIIHAEGQVLFVFSCGYEERSLAQYKRLRDKVPNGKIKFLCFSFSAFKKSGSRPKNDKIIKGDGVDSIQLDTGDWACAWATLQSLLQSDFPSMPPIYIDYSSMPRSWYCNFAVKVSQKELGDRVSFFYSLGEYSQEQYPCVGYGEFHEFSGRPNITSTREINIFGLGFDSIRTHGIWTYLDPQISISLIAATSNNREQCERVKKENPEIIADSETVFEVRVDCFSNMLSTIVDISRKLLPYGDVALVPDGPKPMVLAMSLVPLYLDMSGVYCWHVGHVKPEGYEPIDVRSTGNFYGFQIL